jgi:ornithine cyclodeaminase/alanine dehydrogenase-like protein (mu-crystallin family)
MLVLNSKEIEYLVRPIEMIEAIEQAMLVYEAGDYNMPDRMHIDNDEDTLLLMPVFANNIFSTKLVSVFPGNAKKNISTINGLFVLNNGDTGEATALMNAATLTAHRTAAVSVVGIKHLYQKQVGSIGIVGAGVQGFYQAIYAVSLTNCETIFFYDRSKDDSDKFKNDLQKRIKAKVVFKSSVEDLVHDSDIIITATGSEKPVLPDNEKLYENKMIIAIGSYKPKMKEIPNSLFNLINNCFIDSESAFHETADIIDPLKLGALCKENVSTMGKAILKLAKPDTSTIYYKTVGMALFDLFAANYIFKKAKSKDVGLNINV